MIAFQNSDKMQEKHITNLFCILEYSSKDDDIEK